MCLAFRLAYFPACVVLAPTPSAEAKVATNLSSWAEYSPSLMSFLSVYFLKGIPRNWAFPPYSKLSPIAESASVPPSCMDECWYFPPWLRPRYILSLIEQNYL